ncbi:MAG TPA: DUF1993 domain-containing protein [Gammaproteobacteria bacterium]|nr:DUF1993 domain-containing protein [Gammaproteobacteria bacterium]
MRLTIHDMAVNTFASMLESLSEVLAKGAEHGKKANLDLVDARLAPDMFTLAQQVQQACLYARDCVSRLTGKGGAEMPKAETSFDGCKRQIHDTIGFVRGVPASAFEGAEERDCSIEIPNGMVIEMDGVRLLRSWSLPHFYFHVVTAYDILRHHGVQIGKQDYASQVGAFIRKE